MYIALHFIFACQYEGWLRHIYISIYIFYDICWLGREEIDLLFFVVSKYVIH